MAWQGVFGRQQGAEATGTEFRADCRPVGPATDATQPLPILMQMIRFDRGAKMASRLWPNHCQTSQPVATPASSTAPIKAR
jgi:hypothetical protein